MTDHMTERRAAPWRLRIAYTRRRELQAASCLLTMTMRSAAAVLSVRVRPSPSSCLCKLTSAPSIALGPNLWYTVNIA